MQIKNVKLIMENSISQKIKHILYVLDKNQSQMADDLGVKPQTVSRWVDKGGISNDMVQKICDTYGVNKKWFLLDEGEIFSSKEKNEIEKEFNKSVSPESKSFGTQTVEWLSKELDYMKNLNTALMEEKRIMLAMMSKSSGNRLFAQS